MGTIPTQAPAKGDFVVGHRAAAVFPDAPAVLGEIVAVSPSGHAVIFEVDRVLAALGLPRRSRWTWRRSTGTYQEAGVSTRPGAGLVLVRRRRARAAA